MAGDRVKPRTARRCRFLPEVLGEGVVPWRFPMRPVKTSVSWAVKALLRGSAGSAKRPWIV